MAYLRSGSSWGTRRVGLAMLVAGSVGVASLAAVDDARACGGLFCNSRPPILSRPCRSLRTGKTWCSPSPRIPPEGPPR